MIKNRRGITLIALVVTIVVLLILAGVSISLLIDNNGIINRSKDAKRSYTIGQIKDEVELAYSSVCTDVLTDKITEDEVAKKLGEELGVSVSETNKDYKFKYKGEDITISKTTGQVTEGKEDTEEEVKWIYNEDDDGNIEITGMDFSGADTRITNPDYFPYLYHYEVTLTNSLLVIPEKIEGKDVVKFSLENILLDAAYNYTTSNSVSILGVTKIQSKAKLKEFSTQYGYKYFGDVESVELPESLLNMEWNLGSYSYNYEPDPIGSGNISHKIIHRTVTINFVNGKNSNLEIPEDKWGAKKIISNGEVLYEGPDSEQIT